MADILGINITPALHQLLDNPLHTEKIRLMPQWEGLKELTPPPPVFRLSRAMVIAPTIVQQIQFLTETIIEQLVHIAEVECRDTSLKTTIDRMSIYSDVFDAYLNIVVAKNSNKSIWIVYGTKYRKPSLMVKYTCVSPTLGKVDMSFGTNVSPANYTMTMLNVKKTSLVSSKRLKQWTTTLCEMLTTKVEAQIDDQLIVENSPIYLARLHSMGQHSIFSLWK